MRYGCVGGPLVALALAWNPANAQDEALLADVGPLHVVVDHLNVPSTIFSEGDAGTLRDRLLLRLREGGVPVTDDARPVTYGSLLNATGYAFDQPTLVVSLNMVPDGCAFAASFNLRKPVLLAGQSREVVVTVYASRAYLYTTENPAHNPVLNYLEDFVAAWRTANALDR